MNPELDSTELLRRIKHLLEQAGMPAKCRGCDQAIYFVRHKNGKQAPYTADGLNHFANCPTAERFRSNRGDQ